MLRARLHIYLNRAVPTGCINVVSFSRAHIKTPQSVSARQECFSAPAAGFNSTPGPGASPCDLVDTTFPSRSHWPTVLSCLSAIRAGRCQSGHWAPSPRRLAQSMVLDRRDSRGRWHALAHSARGAGGRGLGYKAFLGAESGETLVERESCRRRRAGVDACS